MICKNRFLIFPFTSSTVLFVVLPPKMPGPPSPKILALGASSFLSSFLGEANGDLGAPKMEEMGSFWSEGEGVIVQRGVLFWGEG